ncbi:MAG: hypothetical protein KatS3mg129_2630 [Leptospiraceae bacterium]|nr:MAG: hypothetical protein KatS3mg129_2630 [Leptospiraceae bacterium]
MESLKEYLTKDHKECDEFFAKVENALHSEKIEEAKNAFLEFYQRTKRHFVIEEDILFPEFEAITVNTMGPTQVMRMEHQDMNYQLDVLKSLLEKEKISKEEINEAKNTLENILFILQQHNMKEEQILYNMMENVFSDSLKKELLEKIKTI